MCCEKTKTRQPRPNDFYLRWRDDACIVATQVAPSNTRCTLYVAVYRRSGVRECVEVQERRRACAKMIFLRRGSPQQTRIFLLVAALSKPEQKSGATAALRYPHKYDPMMFCGSWGLSTTKKRERVRARVVVFTTDDRNNSFRTFGSKLSSSPSSRR